MASNLISCGVDPYEIYSSIYEQREKHQVALMALVIQSVQYSNDNKVAWVVITQEMFNLSSASPADTDGTADFLRTIKGIEVSFVLIELPDNSVKISFRSRGKIIVNDIAQYFDGGGHKFAAGAKVVDVSSEIVIIKIKELLELKGLK
jgi:phosphoesterase RecJ-like protein